MAGRVNFVGNLYRGDRYYLCTERDRPSDTQLVRENISLAQAKELVSSLVLIIAGEWYNIKADV